jgi:hypothetical protein
MAFRRRLGRRSSYGERFDEQLAKSASAKLAYLKTPRSASLPGKASAAKMAPEPLIEAARRKPYGTSGGVRHIDSSKLFRFVRREPDAKKSELEFGQRDCKNFWGSKCWAASEGFGRKTAPIGVTAASLPSRRPFRLFTSGGEFTARMIETASKA